MGSNPDITPFGQANTAKNDRVSTRVYEEYAKVLSGQTVVHEKPVNFALFGCGKIGLIHAKALRDNVRANLLFLVDADIKRAEIIKNLFRLDRTQVVDAKDTDKIFEDPNVHAVIVGTTTDSHEKFVLEALEHGKAVLCEKPLASDIKGAQRCRDLAKKKNLPLYVAFNRRSDPSYGNIKQSIDRGELGPLHVVKTCSRDSPMPPLVYLTNSGRVFHDCLVHDIDMCCWITNEKPVKVSAMAHAHREPIRNINDWDTVACLLHFPSGVIGVIDISRHATYGYDQRLEALGLKGQLATVHQKPTLVEAYGSEGIMTDPVMYSFPSRYEEAYVTQLDTFIGIIKGNSSKILADADDAIAVTLIAEELQTSALTGTVRHLKWN